MVCLKGNHERPTSRISCKIPPHRALAAFSGLETLISYGVTPSVNTDQQRQRKLAIAFRRAPLESHRRFLTGLKTSPACGDYFLCMTVSGQAFRCRNNTCVHGLF
jgi:serine/threonine protein phosphatase 1